MAGLIPENILEDVLSRVDIVEVISGYIPLKRAGRNFKANCPFHHEKTASFMVSPDRQIYHCFGCGESGNAFKFLMRYERLEFPEAVEQLARKTGVILPQNPDVSPASASISSQLYKINELAAAFYETNLHSPDASGPRKYLISRGIKEDTAKLFKLGFSFDKWDGLINHLRQKNAPLSLLEKAGLILAKDGGGYYDRFRNRIIFPIFDIKSKVVGFGARVLDASMPKYMNSPETPVYVKGKCLFGLNFAKDAIRQEDSAVVVEGYLDFIIPYQEGLKNIVASSGTALTEEQIRLLKRFTHNIVMVYDGDSAGQMATLRALDMFIAEGLTVRVAPLPEGFDPDTFVRKHGIAAFREKIANAENLFDYKLKILRAQYGSKGIEGKAKISAEMLPTINKFTDAVLKSEYIKKLADELSVNEDALLAEIGKLKEIKPGFPASTSYADRKKAADVNPTEKLLIKLMLEEDNLIDHVRQHLSPEDFQGALTCKIVSAMYDLAGKGRDINKAVLIDHFGDEDILHVVCESAFMPEVSDEQREKVVGECIRRLKSEKIKSRQHDLHDQIKAAQRLGDNKRLNSLMQEFHLLIKKG
ncbi:MAG: DNA primase [Candidatus Omnitrophota bacterium]